MTQLSKPSLVLVRQTAPRAKRRLATWIQAVNGLIQQVKVWSNERDDWDITEQEHEITEARSGTYSTLKLTIDTSARSSLILEPRALDVLGSDGRVDLYAYPTLYRVQLLRNEAEGIWIVHTDSGIDWPDSWSRDTFFDLAQRLTQTK